MMAGKLSDRDAIMVDEFLIDLDAKNAAIRAGYSPKTAAKASEWIRRDNPTKPKLRAEIDRRLAERSRRTGVTADRVLMELARLGTANIADIIDLETGKIHDDITRDSTAAIASIKIRETPATTETEIRMVDKAKIWETIGRHLGMFADNVNINASTPIIRDDIGEGAANG